MTGYFKSAATALQTASDIASPRAKARKVLLRPFVDASIVFAVLCFLGLTLGTAPTSASPNIPGINGYQLTVSGPVTKAIGSQETRPVVEIATTSSPNNPDAVFHRTSAQAAWALLMIALSIVAALNLALYRHMRTAYTPPRRRNPQN